MRSGRTILLVEDCDEIRTLLTSILRAEGHQVIEAPNGSVALAALARGGAPELILLDMKMPIMDGWQFAEAYRKNYPSPAPIIVMSAASNVGLRGVEVGAVHWLDKPFAVEDLLAAIERFAKTG